jgi:hypothetical protein
MSKPTSWQAPRGAKGAHRVPISEDGIALGEHHHRARYSDALVEAVRNDHERHGLGYRRLGRKYGLCIGTVRGWCRYLRRATTPAGWRTVAGGAELGELDGAGEA